MPEDKNRVREQNEEATKKRASLLGVRYIDSRSIRDFTPVKGMLEIKSMYENKYLPLKMVQGHIDVAITIQTPQGAIKNLRERFSDYNITYHMISDFGFTELMLIYDPPPEVEYDDISIQHEGDSDNLKTISETLEQVKPDDMLDYLVTQASMLNASDIHLEAEKDHIRLRFRIDGALHAIAKISPEKYRQLQSSVAIKANIASQAPDAQTGHLNIEIELPDGMKKAINMRIETVPTTFGQDAVLRMFNMDKSLLNLDKLGLSQPDRDAIDDIMSSTMRLQLELGYFPFLYKNYQ